VLRDVPSPDFRPCLQRSDGLVHLHPFCSMSILSLYSCLSFILVAATYVSRSFEDQEKDGSVIIERDGYESVNWFGWLRSTGGTK